MAVGAVSGAKGVIEVLTEKDVADEGFHSKYDLGQCLGKGAFGTVFSATCIDSGKQLAVKVLALPCRAQKPCDIPMANTLQDCLAEFDTWKRVGRHRNIVSLQGFFADGNFVHFVMERCPRTLLQAWSKHTELNEYTYAKYFREMATALEHIHSVGIVHRDVKQDNFLLGGQSRRTVKLCDFGMAAVLSQPHRLTGTCGTAPYMSPEMVTPRAAHGTASDVWSLGVVVYMAFYGTWPYAKQKTKEATMQVICDGQTMPPFRPRKKLGSSVVSIEALQFVQGLLTRDPASRPSATECLQMEYLRREQPLDTYGKGISLSPMLCAAIRAGAFGNAQPRADQYTADAMWELQTRARVRTALRSKFAQDVNAGLWNLGSGDIVGV